MSKSAKLSPTMEQAVRLLERYGFIERALGVKSATIVGLMKRNIIRESGRSSSHLHFATTTPEQVWDDANTEDARRTAEIDAYMADSTRWVQVRPEGDLDAHTRQTRDGATLLIVRTSFRLWHVYVGDAMKFSAGGDWADVRATADRYERDAAHDEVSRAIGVHGTHCCKEHGCKYGKADCLVASGVVAQEFACEECMDAAEELAKSVKQPTTPATARTGISDRAAAALEDLYVLHRAVNTGGRMPQRDADMNARISRIEQALRSGA